MWLLNIALITSTIHTNAITCQQKDRAISAFDIYHAQITYNMKNIHKYSLELKSFMLIVIERSLEQHHRTIPDQSLCVATFAY